MDRSAQLSRIALLVAAAAWIALAAGCTSTARPIYRPAEARPSYPRWVAFPALGADLPATLDALFDRGGENALVSLGELALFRTDTDPWQELLFEDLPRRNELASGGYALAVRRFCRTFDDVPVVVGANEWFLFEAGRLSAYDARSYASACAFTPAIEPARGDAVEREERLRAIIAEQLPAEDVPRVVQYARGLAYADAGRLEAAEAFLRAGDAAAPTPPGVRVNPLRIGRAVSGGPERLPHAFDDASARALLVEQIENLRAQPLGE